MPATHLIIIVPQYFNHYKPQNFSVQYTVQLTVANHLGKIYRIGTSWLYDSKFIYYRYLSQPTRPCHPIQSSTDTNLIYLVTIISRNILVKKYNTIFKRNVCTVIHIYLLWIVVYVAFNNFSFIVLYLSTKKFTRFSQLNIVLSWFIIHLTLMQRNKC